MKFAVSCLALALTLIAASARADDLLAVRKFKLASGRFVTGKIMAARIHKTGPMATLIESPYAIVENRTYDLSPDRGMAYRLCQILDGGFETDSYTTEEPTGFAPMIQRNLTPSGAESLVLDEAGAFHTLLTKVMCSSNWDAVTPHNTGDGNDSHGRGGS